MGTKGNKRKSGEGEDHTHKKKMKEQKPNSDTSSLISVCAGRRASSHTDDGSKYRLEHGISINMDEPLFDPIRDFSELDFPPTLLKCLQNFSNPSPIQSQCWPIALSRRDLIGIAETGSGKTLAFSVPILYHIHCGTTRNKYPSVLILSPTRELATQISSVCTEAGTPSGIRTVCIYGGVQKSVQCKELKGAVDIIVATPGRLMDLLGDGFITLDHIRFFVLDEADRMLDMGFEKDIRSIAENLPESRQTMMFSATWPQPIKEISEKYLKNPVKVVIGSPDLAANNNIKQIVEVIKQGDRDARLRQLLKLYHNGQNKVLVFVLYKKEATRVEAMLRDRGWNVQGIHADKSQVQRTTAMESFRTGRCPMLVATDVAARGIDINDVEYVINYSFPLTIEDYIHRIGRTGRAGKTGIAHTFFTNFDKAHSGELVQVLKQAGQEVPPDLLKFGTVIKPKAPKLGTISIDSCTDGGHLVFN